MKKKNRLSLDELKVNSFVTSIAEPETAGMKGGTELSCTQQCDTSFRGCIISRHNVCIRTEPPICQIWSDTRGCLNTLVAGC